MAATLSPPRILPSGDAAITVEFSRKIDDEANRRVLTLDRVLADRPIAGITETVPTYRSLLVHYDPAVIDFDTLAGKLLACAQREARADLRARRWRIPVTYGGEHGIDLEDVATVVALEDCTIAVMPAPAPTADQRLVVHFERMERSAPPARALSPSVIRIMPSRNSPTPPITLETTVNMA